MKLFEEAVPPGSLEHKVICPVKLLVEAVPTGSLMGEARCRATLSGAARFRSRWLRFLFHGLVSGDQQIPDAEVPARNVRQVRLFDSRVTAVLTEHVDKHLRYDPAADRTQFCTQQAVLIGVNSASRKMQNHNGVPSGKIGSRMICSSGIPIASATASPEGMS